MRMIWGQNSPVHNRATRQHDARGQVGERQRREEAFGGTVATLNSMNGELRDLTGQIPGGFAEFAAIRAERPLLSVTCWSTATCEEFKLAKVLSRLPLSANRSSFPQAPLCLVG